MSSLQFPFRAVTFPALLYFLHYCIPSSYSLLCSVIFAFIYPALFFSFLFLTCSFLDLFLIPPPLTLSLSSAFHSYDCGHLLVLLAFSCPVSFVQIDALFSYCCTFRSYYFLYSCLLLRLVIYRLFFFLCPSLTCLAILLIYFLFLFIVLCFSFLLSSYLFLSFQSLHSYFLLAIVLPFLPYLPLVLPLYFFLSCLISISCLLIPFFSFFPYPLFSLLHRFHISLSVVIL